MTYYVINSRDIRNKRLEQLHKEKRKQPGIEFPKPGNQQHLLIIRLDLASPNKDRKETNKIVQQGLRRLCGLFERIDVGRKKIDRLDSNGNVSRKSLNEFNFSATVGFSIGFFDKLGIPENKRPNKIKSMPDHTGLGDVTGYTLAQTDLIIQLGSSSDFVNRWMRQDLTL